MKVRNAYKFAKNDKNAQMVMIESHLTDKFLVPGVDGAEFLSTGGVTEQAVDEQLVVNNMMIESTFIQMNQK